MRRSPRVTLQPKGRTGAAITTSRGLVDAAVGGVVGTALGAVTATVLAQVAVVLVDNVLGIFGSGGSRAHAKQEIDAEGRVAVAANAGRVHEAADVL